MKLWFKIFFLLFTTSIIPASILSYVHFTQTKKASVRMIFQSLRGISETKKNRIEQSIHQYYERIDFINSNITLGSLVKKYIENPNHGTQKKIVKMISQTEESLAKFDEITILDKKGILIATSLPLDKEDFKNSEEFEAGKSKKHLKLYHSNGLLWINISSPLLLYSDTLGVIIIKSPATNIIDAVNDHTGLGKTGESILAERSGDKALFLTRVRKSEQVELQTVEVPKTSPIWIALQRKDTVLNNFTDFTGAKVFSSTRFIKETGWGLTTQIDESEAMDFVSTLKAEAIKMLFVTLLLIMFLTFIVSRYITAPIFRITNRAKYVIKEVSPERFPVISAGDELDQLQDFFDAMTKSLLDTRSRLIELNLSLENKVAMRTEDLKLANVELENFNKVTAHDLQEPLRSITSYLQLLMMRNQENLSKESLEYINIAIQAARRMRNLIGSLLEYAQLRENIQIEKINIHELLDEVSKSFISDKVKIFIEINLINTLYGNTFQLRQLFWHLIRNAIRFNNKEIKKAYITVVEEEAYFLFTISDNGIGIESQYQEKIFQLFQQLNKESEQDAVGIGLFISTKIVQFHQGRIWFTSKPGKGSRFCFTVKKKL